MLKLQVASSYLHIIVTNVAPRSSLTKYDRFHMSYIRKQDSDMLLLLSKLAELKENHT